MKLIALQSFINAELASVLDYLLPPVPRHFCRVVWFDSSSAPSPLRNWVHPLMSFISSSEYMTASNPPVRPQTTSTFLGAFVPIATAVKRVFLRCRSNQTSTDDVLKVSHLLDVRTQNTLWVYFAPQPRPGFTFQGFSPLFSRHNSSKCRPLMTLSNFLLPLSKLIGAESRNLASRGLIQTAIRSSQQGV